MVVPLLVQPAATLGLLEVIVNFLLAASVVREMPVPAAKVKVSELEEAVMSSWPETVIVLNMFWEDPLSVFSILLPDIEMPLPAVRLTEIFKSSEIVIPVPDCNKISPV